MRFLLEGGATGKALYGAWLKFCQKAIELEGDVVLLAPDPIMLRTALDIAQRSAKAARMRWNIGISKSAIISHLLLSKLHHQWLLLLLPFLRL